MATIVCAVDGSPGAGEALRMATALSKTLGVRLVLAHVANRVRHSAALAPGTETQARDQAASLLAHLCEEHGLDSRAARRSSPAGSCREPARVPRRPRAGAHLVGQDRVGGVFQCEDPRFPEADFAVRPGVKQLSVGFVGTYPPMRCGIATFTASLARAMAPSGAGTCAGVVACVDRPGVVGRPPEVAVELVNGSVASRIAAVAALDEFDVVVVQHEFGIFGGEDGSEIVDLVARLHAPAIVVLHTVPRRPTSGQRAVIERLAELAQHVVTQSLAARVRLLETHMIEPRKVSVIPHGAPANLTTETSPADPARRPVVLTWGLVGPSKGIEWAIEAMALLRDVEPQPRYVVAGQTHPRILETRGEEYRASLVARAAALGISHIVEFDDAYRDLDSILARIREADVVLLPYLSREQVVSGVLAEAVASGKPVVATRFPHAEELLGEGSGILVAHEDAEAIAGALRSLLTDPDRTARVTAVARRQALSLFWENVGGSYLQLAHEVVCDAEHARELRRRRPPFAPLLRLSHDGG